MTSRERQLDAVHESAHAVATVVLGGKVNSLNIKRNGHLNGVCNIVEPEGIVKNIAINLSGAAAEADFRFRRGERYHPGCRKDLADTDELLRTIYGDRFTRREECKEFIVGETLSKQIVFSYWGAIKRLSKWLLEHEEASGKLCVAIVTAHCIAARERGVA
jgi:hypothetical protein